jgi:hypothetical protein
LLLTSTYTLALAADRLWHLPRADCIPLSEEEATNLARCTKNYLRHFDIGASAKTLDLLALMQAIGTAAAMRVWTMAQAAPAGNGGPPLDDGAAAQPTAAPASAPLH